VGGIAMRTKVVIRILLTLTFFAILLSSIAHLRKPEFTLQSADALELQYPGISVSIDAARETAKLTISESVDLSSFPNIKNLYTEPLLEKRDISENEWKIFSRATTLRSIEFRRCTLPKNFFVHLSRHKELEKIVFNRCTFRRNPDVVPAVAIRLEVSSVNRYFVAPVIASFGESIEQLLLSEISGTPALNLPVLPNLKDLEVYDSLVDGEGFRNIAASQRIDSIQLIKVGVSFKDIALLLSKRDLALLSLISCSYSDLEVLPQNALSNARAVITDANDQTSEKLKQLISKNTILRIIPNVETGQTNVPGTRGAGTLRGESR
jgi:hypothetical protein